MARERADLPEALAMTTSPRIVCCACSKPIDSIVQPPLYDACFADSGIPKPGSAKQFCPLCAHYHQRRSGLHYNKRGGYIGKCAAEVSA